MDELHVLERRHDAGRRTGERAPSTIQANGITSKGAIMVIDAALASGM